MRILSIYTGIYPDHIGGVEKRNLDLARELIKLGHEVTLAGFVENPDRLPSDVPTLSLGEYRPLYNDAGRRLLTEALRYGRRASRIDLSPFDVVETASVPFTHLGTQWASARRCRVPLVITWYEYWDSYWYEYLPFPLAAVAKLYERRAARSCGNLLVCTSELTATRIERAVSRTPMILPIGVDATAIAEAAGRVAPGPSLLCVGRLVPEKRFDLAIRALGELVRRMEDVGMRIVGDGPDRGRLQALAGDLGVERRIEWIDRTETEEEMWRILGSARLLIHPSAREGFGIVAIEAMAAGLPVVACESPENAMAELVDEGVNGFVVPADVGALSDRISHLSTAPHRMSELANNAQESAQRYSWSGIAEDYERILRMVATAARS